LDLKIEHTGEGDYDSDCGTSSVHIPVRIHH